MTHHEQEWLFLVVTILFDWVKWCVVALRSMSEQNGVILPPPPHLKDDGRLIDCPEQAKDTDEGNLAELPA